MNLKEALQKFGKKFAAYHQKKLGKQTAHNGTCTSVYIELFVDVDGDLSGDIILVGARTDLPKTPEGNLMANLYTGDHNKQVDI